MVTGNERETRIPHYRIISLYLKLENAEPYTLIGDEVITHKTMLEKPYIDSFEGYEPIEAVESKSRKKGSKGKAEDRRQANFMKARTRWMYLFGIGAVGGLIGYAIKYRYFRT